MKLVTKSYTNKNGVKICTYYLHNYIPIFKRKCNILKNALNMTQLFNHKKIDINCPIDIIIPVYNGFQFLDNLFSSLRKNTDIPYRILVINDCSTDERIKPLLNNWNNVFGSQMIIINNATNQGFVKSVNIALKHTSNHVVLVNTDVIVPQNWASRLLYPILVDEKVASVTPFTNSATLFSIPQINLNNEFNGDLEKINNKLSLLATPYQNLNLPTGVGFCMAMNKKAINDIGFLDEIFGKGYGEENDWCQRAIQKGYTNTIAANLFVWHQHGGSFISDDKIKLIKNHSRILRYRYPNYEKDVKKTIKNEYFLSLRFVVELLYFQP